MHDVCDAEPFLSLSCMSVDLMLDLYHLHTS